MGLISIEHQPLAYWADAAWYGAVVIGLAVALGVGMPAVPGWTDWWPRRCWG